MAAKKPSEHSKQIDYMESVAMFIKMHCISTQEKNLAQNYSAIHSRTLNSIHCRPFSGHIQTYTVVLYNKALTIQY